MFPFNDSQSKCKWPQKRNNGFKIASRTKRLDNAERWEKVITVFYDVFLLEGDIRVILKFADCTCFIRLLKNICLITVLLGELMYLLIEIAINPKLVSLAKPLRWISQIFCSQLHRFILEVKLIQVHLRPFDYGAWDNKLIHHEQIIILCSFFRYSAYLLRGLFKIRRNFLLYISRFKKMGNQHIWVFSTKSNNSMSGSFMCEILHKILLWR